MSEDRISTNSRQPDINQRLSLWRASVLTAVALDLLLRVNAEESDHRIRAVVAVWFQPALRGNRRHTGGTLVCLPRRAVARSMRPRRNPCHCRANHRWFATPCGSGTASHRFRSIRDYWRPRTSNCRDKRAECRSTSA
jgi:hypothetical protein